LVEKASVLAAGKKMPVSVSPAVVIAGAAAVPATKAALCDVSIVTAVVGVDPVWKTNVPAVSVVILNAVVVVVDALIVDIR